jgi:hypothetical protein
LPTGSQSFELERWTIIRDEAGVAVDTTVATQTLSFEVGTTCSPAPPLLAGDLPFVVSASILPHACAGMPLELRLEGVFPNDCGSLVSVDSSSFALTIAPYPPVTSPCAPVLSKWVADFPLGALAAGHHRVKVRMTVLGSDEAYPPITTLTYDGLFDFDVPVDCNHTERLPYVDYIHVGPKPPDIGAICENDSMQVTLGGWLPSACVTIDSVLSYPPPYASPLPMPPIIRLVVSDHGCDRIACPTLIQPWSRTLTIPGLPRGSYSLFVEEERTLGCPPLQDHHAAVEPFHVAPAESCGVPPGQRCLWPIWNGSTFGECNGFVAPGDTTEAAIGIRTGVALAGLEGSFHVSGEGARIVGLETIGPAIGMSLSWTPTADGVRFVMFALQGAPIPPNSPIDLSITPILRLRVALAPQSQADRIVLGTGFDWLGSDIHGQAVPLCPYRERSLPPELLICVGRGECEFNGDGHLDVRDLVLMVHCAVFEECPADPTRYDCDGDGQLQLDDVLCCASELLRGPGCPSCPVDTVRAAPEVAVRFGAPRRTDGGVEVPIRIFGAFSVGAARLELRFPSERFDVAAIVGRQGWLELHQVHGDELSLGIINGLGPVVAGPVVERDFTGEPLELTLRLTSRGSARPGGSLRLVDSDFSGNDGVKLRVDPTGAQLTLGESGGVELSAAQPNPFQGSTRFSVQIDRAGALDVGIYDLAGRRIATLFHGNAEAGARAFTWDGRKDDGGMAGGGVYFYRALSEGHSASKKIVMRRGN